MASSISAVGLGACTLDVPPPPTVTVAPSTPPSLDDVVIGAIVSLNGPLSREGALMRAGYQAWLDAVQRAGGLRIGGVRRPVRLEFADDESEPLTAGQRVERLANDLGIRLILGPYSSQLTGAVAGVAEKQGSLVVAADGSGPGLFRRGFKLFVSVKPLDTAVLHGLADLAATVQPRAEPIGVLLSDELPISTEVDGFRERALALGLGSVQVEPFTPGSTDLVAPLERLGQLAPRLLVVASSPAQLERLVARVHDELAPVPMRALIHLPEVRDPSVPATRYDGALTVQVWSASRSLTGPLFGSASDFAASFKRLHGYSPDATCAAAAAAGLALQLGIEAAGSVEPLAVRQALSTLDTTTFWGRLTWDVDGRLRDPVIPVVQQRGDDSVIVYPPDLATSQVQYPLTDWPRL